MGHKPSCPIPAGRPPVHLREVFADARADRAAAVIVAHNQPPGSLEPSAADIAAKAQLKVAGTVLGIALLDRILFNRTGYSFCVALTLLPDLERY